LLNFGFLENEMFFTTFKGRRFAFGKNVTKALVELLQRTKRFYYFIINT